MSQEEEEFAECEPGIGGYQIAVYKHNNLKRLEPLEENTYRYVKSKFKKHSSVKLGAAAAAPRPKGSGMKGVKKGAVASLPKSEKKISKIPATAAVTAAGIGAGAGGEKPKRQLTEKQREALARGRERRKEQLAHAAAIAANA